MEYVYSVAIVVVFSLVASYFESRHKRLSAPGKYKASYVSNLVRNLVTFGVIVGVVVVLREVL